MKSIWSIFRQSKRFVLACFLCIASAFADGNAGNSLFAFQSRVIEFSTHAEQMDAKNYFTIIGGVNRPGCYVHAKAKLKLQEIVEMAGGQEQNATTKVRIVRAGGGGAVVCMYPAQQETEILPAEIVIVERPTLTSSRVIEYSQQLTETQQAGNPVVRNAQYERERPSKQDHIVLLGLTTYPVVMPLWEKNITADSLLTFYLKQPQIVVANTKLLSGRFSPYQPGVLQPGMVLSIPSELVQRRELPPLPVVLEKASVNQAAQSAQQFQEHVPQTLPGDPATKTNPAPMIDTKPVETTSLPTTAPGLNLGISTPASSPSFVDRLTIAAITDSAEPDSLPGELQTVSPPADVASDRYQVADTIIPDLKETPFQLNLPHAINTAEKLATAEQNTAVTPAADTSMTIPNKELIEQPTHTLRPLTAMLESTFEPTPVDSSELTSAPAASKAAIPFAEVLKQKTGAQKNLHLAEAGEIVPRPREIVSAGSSNWIGMIAGTVVIVGVLTVITAAIQTHLFPDVDWTPTQIPSLLKRQFSAIGNQQAKTSAASLKSFTEPNGPENRPNTPIEKQPLKAATTVSNRTEPNSTSAEISQKSIVEMPVIIEQVRLPRELKFFGKPEQHYEFRIDASHKIPKPHLLQTRQPPLLDPDLAVDQFYSLSPSSELDTAPANNQPDNFAPHSPDDLFSRAYAMKQAER